MEKESESYSESTSDKNLTEETEDRSIEKKVTQDVTNEKDDVEIKTSVDNEQQNWSRTVTDAKCHAIDRLQNELQLAQQELKLKDEEVTRLSQIRLDVERELEELTASLFQEAHTMVRQANEKQQAAEKALKECRMKCDVFAAEVCALKTLVLTSTPSRPNGHLHPQISIKSKDDSSMTNLFSKTHRRSPSLYTSAKDLQNASICTISGGGDSCQRQQKSDYLKDDDNNYPEVDPIVYEEFLLWYDQPCLERFQAAFLRRVYTEDIDFSLTFKSEALSKQVKVAVEAGTILIEAVMEQLTSAFPKKCALMEVSRLCMHRMNIGGPNQWYNISQLCRNRIITVCDFLNYLKYIERGLVKNPVNEIYWEIVRLRKEMVMARLGLNLT